MPTALDGTTNAAQDPISNFFTILSAGHVATFEGQSASIRFDILDGNDVDSWHLTVTGGEVSVMHASREADAIVRIDRPRFEAMVQGRLNAQAAILRGALACDGSMAALVMFQRALPGPPGSTGRVAPISSETVMAEHQKAKRRAA